MTVEEKGQMAKMNEKLDRVADHVDDIRAVLIGDDLGHSDGLVAEVKDIKKRVRVLEDLKRKIIWICTGAGLVGGLALDKIFAFFKAIFLSAIILTLVSCALFKRSEKASEKSEILEKVSEKSETESEKSENIRDKSLDKLESDKKVSVQNDVESWTGISADQIVIDSKGNMWATGNAKYNGSLRDQSKRDEAGSEKSEKQNDVSIDRKALDKSNAEYNQSYLDKQSSKQSVSKPSGTGILFGSIGILLIVLGILFYFGFRPKR